MFDHEIVCPSYQSVKYGCVTRSSWITMLWFQLLWTVWVTVQAKNKVKSAPANTGLTKVLHYSHNMCTTNFTYTVVEKRMEHKEGQWQALENHDKSIGAAVVGKKAWMGMKQHWTVKKIKPTVLVIIELCLSLKLASWPAGQLARSISQPASQL